MVPEINMVPSTKKLSRHQKTNDAKDGAGWKRGTHGERWTNGKKEEHRRRNKEHVRTEEKWAAMESKGIQWITMHDILLGSLAGLFSFRVTLKSNQYTDGTRR